LSFILPNDIVTGTLTLAHQNYFDCAGSAVVPVPTMGCGGSKSAATEPVCICVESERESERKRESSLSPSRLCFRGI